MEITVRPNALTTDWRDLFSERMTDMENDALASLLALGGRSDIISFAGGLPDAATFLNDKVADVLQQVVREIAATALQYGPTPGLPATRDWFVSYLARHEGITRPREAVMVTSGGIEALDLLNKVLVDPGDIVLMEAPTYLGACMVTASYQGQIRGVPIDDDGLDVAALRHLLDDLERERRRPKMLYTIPDYQNPSGITMSAARRDALVAVAAERGLLLVEDLAYRLLGWADDQPATLWSRNPDGVVLIDTYAKTLFPAARIACVAGPAQIIQAMTLAKQTTDQFASTLSQCVLLEFDRRGWWDEQLRHARAIYAQRCRRMLDSMERLLPPDVRWTEPRGGFFTWVTLPHGLDSTALARQALERGVAYVPGPPFFASDPAQGQTHLRLSYSYVGLEQIDEGIRRLSAVVADAAAQRQ